MTLRGNAFMAVWHDINVGGLILLAGVTALAGLLCIPLGRHTGVRVTAGETTIPADTRISPVQAAVGHA